MGTNTDTKLIEISPYMHQIGHSLNSREITRNVQEGDYIFALPFCSTHHDDKHIALFHNAPNSLLLHSGRGRLRSGKRRGEVHREVHQLPPRHRRRGLRRRRADTQVS